MIGTNFYYNGVSSASMGVYLIRTSSGLINLPYIPQRDLIEEFPTMSQSPFSSKAKAQQYQFTLAFSTLTNDMTTAKMKTIATWLFQETYKPFYSTDEPDKIYYLFAINQVDFLTNGIKRSPNSIFVVRNRNREKAGEKASRQQRTLPGQAS